MHLSANREPKIARLERARRDDAARVLVRAFDDSPIMRYLLPGDSLRARGLRTFFLAAVADALPFGEAWVATASDSPAGERVIGTAMWLPPGAYPATGLRAARQLARLVTFAPRAPRRLPRSMRYLRFVEQVHPKEPHWYLGFLGVDPPRQGQGIGTRLLEAVLPRIDDAGEAAYLETDKERNIPYYARQRFALVDTLRPAPDGPPTWTMWRPPV